MIQPKNLIYNSILQMFCQRIILIISIFILLTNNQYVKSINNNNRRRNKKEKRSLQGNYNNNNNHHVHVVEKSKFIAQKKIMMTSYNINDCIPCIFARTPYAPLYHTFSILESLEKNAPV